MEKGNRESTRAPRKQIRDFTSLETWQLARKLRAELYQWAQSLPAEERYGLGTQIRRAAVSVTANLAEGYGRFSYQENMQFCRQSRGSVYELRDHFTTALDAGYLSREKYEELESLAMQVIRLLNGYIRKTKELKETAGKG